MDCQTAVRGPDKQVPPKGGRDKHVPPTVGPDWQVPPFFRRGEARFTPLNCATVSRPTYK